MGLENIPQSENNDVEPISAPRERVDKERIQAEMTRVYEEQRKKQAADEAIRNWKVEAFRQEIMNRPEIPTTQPKNFEPLKTGFRSEDEAWDYERLDRVIEKKPNALRRFLDRLGL